MAVTSLSLLDRVRGAGLPADWAQFHSVYRPLIRSWVQRVPGLGGEADDVVQNVWVVVVQVLPDFVRQREGSFRTWLRRVTANRLREYWRGRARRADVGGVATEAFLDQFADPASELATEWDREHDSVVFERLLDVVRPDFSPATWAAFDRFAVRGEPAAAVAAALGVTENAVLLSKARVLKRLREEAGLLLD